MRPHTFPISICSLVSFALAVSAKVQSQPLTWTDLNATNGSSIQSLLILPSGETIAGDDSGRVLRFQIGGADWSRTSLPSSALSGPPVAALAIHPNGHLFAAAGAAVFASVDGGNRWIPLSNSGGLIKRALACTPGGTLVAAGGRAVFRSTDEGTTWRFNVFTGIDISSLLPYDADLLFMGSSRGIYSSTDDGATWVVADSALLGRDVRALVRDASGRIYAATDTGAFFSADTGRSWSRGSGLPAASAICALSGGDLLAGNGTAEIFRSTDRGVTWGSAGASPIINPRCLAGGTPGEARGGAVDGLYISSGGGASWTKQGRGLAGRRLTAVGATPSRVAVAANDGAIYCASFGEPWSRAANAPTGTAVHALVGIAPTTIFLAGTSGAGISRSADGAANWQAANTGLTNMNVHAIMSRTPAVLFAGTDGGVFRSLDSGKSWTATGPGLPSFPVRALGGRTTTPLYAGTGGGGVYRSTDDGASWAAASTGLAGLDVRSLAVTPGGGVLAGVEGAGIFFSSNDGASWSPANSGIPDRSPRSFGGQISGEVFAATSSGVFTAPTPGSAWTAETVGLPASPPTGLVLVMDRYLLCSTDGSGLYAAWTLPPLPPPPPVTNWMSVGSLHNWYSSMGSEIEEGRVYVQQDGMQWPAIMPRQDMQAWRGLWIGATGYTDLAGMFYPRKVVHVGPRVRGTGEFIPVAFGTTSRFEPPSVLVDGVVSQLVSFTNDAVDPALEADRAITNEVNTALGISMKRRILQFSHPLHDNYIVQEYEFTNTGNLDADPFIEQPGVTLDSVHFYFLNRWAICRDVRPVIGNSTGWGVNTMLDGRGDGVMADPPQEQFRTQFAWHGKLPSFTYYDNIGGPIWYPYLPYHGPADTTGRLGSPQFAGVVTLHADASPSNHADAPSQPSTTSWEGADEADLYANSQFDMPKMVREYAWITRGHRSPRHAWQVEPAGNFAQPTGDPALGTPGGFTATAGYGPYRLAPGDTVRIVIAEAAAGLSQKKRATVGRLFKQGLITARAKNDSVLTGRDSLFQTFRRALANYRSGYGIAVPPHPPAEVRVRSGNPIQIDWQVSGGGPRVNGYRIYRAEGRYDGEYELVGEAGAAERSFRDSSSARGKSYFYYLVARGDSLESGRYYTQTYLPAFRSSVGVEGTPTGVPTVFFLAENYPNPFNPSTTIGYGLPARSVVEITLLNTLGQQVAVLVRGEREAGYHEVRLDGSRLASGVYYYRLQVAGFAQTRKMVIVR